MFNIIYFIKNYDDNDKTWTINFIYFKTYFCKLVFGGGIPKMNKKIGVIGILTVFMLLSLSIATAVSIKKTNEEKESPLYQIRTQNVIQEKAQIFKDKVKYFIINVFENRLFLQLPLIKKDGNSAFYVLSRGGPCTLVKCPLGGDNVNQREWTKLQPICWK